MKVAFEVYTEHDEVTNTPLVLYTQTDFNGNWELCADGGVFFSGNETHLFSAEEFEAKKRKPHSTNKRDIFICRPIGTLEWVVVNGNMVRQASFMSLADAFECMNDTIGSM